MRFVRSVSSFLLYSNLFIALCASAFVLQTSLLAGIKLPGTLYLFVFFATLLEYNVQRFLVLFRNISVPPEPRYQWLFSNKGFFYFLFVLSLAGLSFSVWKLPATTYPWIIVSILLTVFYSFPLVPTDQGFKRLRAIPHMKVLVIGIVWTISTLFLPLSATELPITSFILSAFIRFLFVVAITIPFDVRDVHSDLKRGLKTIPIVFGVKNSYNIAIGMLGFVCLLSWLSHFTNDNYYGLSMAITSILTMAFIKKEGWKTHPYYYYGLLDGTMLLAPVIHYLLFKNLI